MLSLPLHRAADFLGVYSPGTEPVRDCETSPHRFWLRDDRGRVDVAVMGSLQVDAPASPYKDFAATRRWHSA